MVMGRPPKYRSKLEAKKMRNKQHNEYGRTAYEKLQENVPKGTNQRLKEAAKKEGISKRQYLLSAIDERLELTDKIQNNPQ